jgi:NAD(P)H dehydrogenase (quinone)
MSKVLVLYYSSYGHIEAMANAVAEGARKAGATVDIKRVPETTPEDVAKAAYFKLDQTAPVAKIEELANYDAVIVGAPTRFGRMPSQMAAFLDQAGGLWIKGALNGKVGAAFTSSATQHGGNETTLFSIITNLLHFGMVIVGLPYSHGGQMTLDEIVGGAPYGATTIAGGQASASPARSNWKARVTRANWWRRRRPSWQPSPSWVFRCWWWSRRRARPAASPRCPSSSHGRQNPSPICRRALALSCP